MKNLRTKKLTKNETAISTITATEVMTPKPSISSFITASAMMVANDAAEKNIPNSTYQRNFPGLNTNLRFMSQQKILATTKPTAVAIDANEPRVAYQASSPVNSAAGNDKNLTAKSSAARHFMQVAASK